MSGREGPATPPRHTLFPKGWEAWEAWEACFFCRACRGTSRAPSGSWCWRGAGDRRGMANGGAAGSGRQAAGRRQAAAAGSGSRQRQQAAASGSGSGQRHQAGGNPHPPLLSAVSGTLGPPRSPWSRRCTGWVSPGLPPESIDFRGGPWDGPGGVGWGVPRSAVRRTASPVPVRGSCGVCKPEDHRGESWCRWCKDSIGAFVGAEDGA
jgi:hypothetical protein